VYAPNSYQDYPLDKHKDFLKVSQEVKRAAGKRGETGLADQVIQAWKGYLPRELRFITNTIIEVIANALLEMKMRRNELDTKGT